jgi:hypothetical protein
VAQLVDLIEARIAAILESARGSVDVTGFIATPDTIARYFPAARWRRSSYAGHLTDTSYPPGDFDRSYEIWWTELGEEPDPQNPLDGTELVSLAFDLNVGFSYGKEIPQFISTTGTEVAATASTFVSRRWVSEMHRAIRALTFPAIAAGDLGTSISLIDMVRRGKVTQSDNGYGRLVATATIDVRIEIPTGTSYDP